MATHLANDEQTVLTRIIEIAGTRPDTDDGVTYRIETANADSVQTHTPEAPPPISRGELCPSVPRWS